MCPPILAAFGSLFGVGGAGAAAGSAAATTGAAAAGTAAAGSGLSLGSVLSLVGAGVSGLAQMQASRAQAAGLEAQAEFNERQAALERQRGAHEADQIRRQARRMAGEQVAAFASSGVQLSGSPAGIIDNSAAEAALDVSTVLQNASLRAENQSFQAQVNRSNARSVRRSGPIRALVPVIQGASRINWGGLSTIG